LQLFLNIQQLEIVPEFRRTRPGLDVSALSRVSSGSLSSSSRPGDRAENNGYPQRPHLLPAIKVANGVRRMRWKSIGSSATGLARTSRELEHGPALCRGRSPPPGPRIAPACKRVALRSRGTRIVRSRSQKSSFFSAEMTSAGVARGIKSRVLAQNATGKKTDQFRPQQLRS